MQNTSKISLKELIRMLWLKRIRVLYTILAFAILGAMVAFLLPVKYRSASVLLPQSESDRGLGQLGGLAGLSSLVGVNLSSFLESPSGITPELFPEIARSYPFLSELINAPFRFEEEDTIYSFYDQMLAKEKGVDYYFKKYTIKLPRTILELFRGESDQISTGSLSSNGEYIHLDEETHRLMSKIHGSITVRVDSKTGLVTVGFEAPEAFLAAQVTKQLVDQIKAYVIEHQTQQAKENLKFIEARHAEKKKEFEEAQKAYFSYRDATRHAIEERAGIRYQELSDAHQISMQVYQNLAQQKEQARIAVKKETPVFSVIEPVRIPYKKSAPHRSMVLLLFLFIGSAVSCLVVLYDHIRVYLKNLYDRIFEQSI